MILTQSMEDYLKHIYRLQTEEKGAATSAVAEAMDVASASATNMIKRLAELELVDYQSYKGARLTEAGTKIALEIIRHHRLLELYLLEVLGYSWDEVHEEAENLEHHISERFEDKIAELLNQPTHDPHGDPIPTKSGSMPDVKEQPLTTAEPDNTYIIGRVNSQDTARLRYLEKEGLLPGVKLTVTNKEPFEGPITLGIGDNTSTIGFKLATSIFVTHVE